MYSMLANWIQMKKRKRREFTLLCVPMSIYKCMLIFLLIYKDLCKCNRIRMAWNHDNSVHEAGLTYSLKIKYELWGLTRWHRGFAVPASHTEFVFVRNYRVPASVCVFFLYVFFNWSPRLGFRICGPVRYVPWYLFLSSSRRRFVICEHPEAPPAGGVPDNPINQASLLQLSDIFPPFSLSRGIL